MKAIYIVGVMILLVSSSCSNGTGMLTPTTSEDMPIDPVTMTYAPISQTPSGTNTVTPSSTNTPTSYPPVEEMLALGDNHTCRLHPDGLVSCWGWNKFGQSGQPEGGEIIHETVIPDFSGITSVTAGAYHTCALNQKGQVFCWGRNNVGQLGNGSHTDSSTPEPVAGLEGEHIRMVQSGSMHTCAVGTDGAVYCWGSNREGKLGNGTDQFESNRAVPVTGLDLPVRWLAAGSNHTCAVDDNNGLWCWGDGSYGQIGLKPFAGSTTPIRLDALPGEVVDLQAGWFHTCLLDSTGRVTCWGKNEDGQLGNAALISRADRVSPVGLVKDVRLLAVGGQTSCAVTTNDRILCWGKNSYGQIGDQRTKDRLIPTETFLGEGVQAIYVGGSHSCVIGISGQLYCWGANDLNQTGSYNILEVPTAIPTRTLAGS